MLKKQHAWLDHPVKCDVCGSVHIGVAENKVLYGKNYGPWPVIWYCYDCKAGVGCHAQTTYPLGRMASQETRQLRRQVHKRFDPLWQKKGFDRNGAYAWLAKKLGIERKDCHVSYFDSAMCQKVLEVLKNEGY